VRLLFLATLAIEVGLSPTQFSQQTGLPGFVAGKLYQAAKLWQASQLERALAELFSLDWQAKTGRIDAALGLELWVAETIN
jgi:DNA polymerase III delta subunit